MEYLAFHWTDFHEFLYLRIFRKSVANIWGWFERGKKNGYFTWIKCDCIARVLLQTFSVRVLSYNRHCVHFVDILMSSVTKCSINKHTVCRKVLPTSASPHPHPAVRLSLCRRKVSLMVTDTELRTLLTGGADFLLKSIWSRKSSVSVVNRPREGPLSLPTLFFSGCCSVERNFEYFRGAHWVRWQSKLTTKWQHCCLQKPSAAECTYGNL
jgi:hypothetical protein